MSPQPLRPTSLHFFEEMFEPFIDQSRNITIRYQIRKEKAKTHDNLTIVVCSVNDSETPDDFQRKLTAITDASIQQVGIFLQQQNPAHIDAQVDFIIGKLDALGSIVVDESFLLQDELNGGFRHARFKSFSKSRYDGPKIDDWSISGPVICYKTQKFAEVWLQVIHDAKNQINMIRNMQKTAWLANTASSSHEKPDGKKFKIKFNLSVDQEAYLFHFLVKSDIIDVPDRKNPLLFKWMTNNLQSKNCESNSHISVRNKYFSHDLSTLDFWHHKFLEGLEIIDNERERLLKFIPK